MYRFMFESNVQYASIQCMTVPPPINLNSGKISVTGYTGSKRPRRSQSATLFLILASILLGKQISLLNSAHNHGKDSISKHNAIHILPLDGKMRRKLSDSTEVDIRVHVANHTNDNITSITSPTLRYQPPAGGFAACLLIKDDNHLLDEWIAYHSVMLPLKYLLVAIDPMSHQSPFRILKKWNDTSSTGLNMTIDVWTDANYIHKRQMQRVCNRWHDMNMLKNHRSRQAVFMTSCAKHMKKRGFDWTISIDSDEFLTFNSIADDEEAPPRELKSEKHVMWRDHIATARRRLPLMWDANTTIYNFLTQERDEVPWSKKACVVLPRLLFSSVEGPEEEQSALVEASKEIGIDLKSLNTQRFFRNAGKAMKSSSKYNALGKPIMDLSRIDLDRTGTFKNPHNPIRDCGTTHARFDESLFRVHHYLGTKDQYAARRDVRRSDEVYVKKAKLEKGINSDLLLTWLRIFVQKVGKEKGKELLKGAGKVFDEDPFDLCDGGRNQNVTVPWVPHYLSVALEQLIEKDERLAHLKK